MAKQRRCATCGHLYSMSAASCPHCNRETAKQDLTGGRVPCCEVGCAQAATICVNGEWRCGPHHTARQFAPHGDGPGYQAFKAKLEAERQRPEGPACD